VLKGIVATIGLVGGLIIMALVGFAIGIFAFWFSKIFIGFSASIIDTAPFIESIIQFLYASEYSDLIQYIFIGSFTILTPLSWYLNGKD
jgi:hypothetical protein